MESSKAIRRVFPLARAWEYLVVLVVALALRACGLGEQNLWHDEHLTLSVASAPIEELPDLLRTVENNKPPLYFALVHYWLALGAEEFWLRLPSVLFGALGCVVAAAIRRELFGPRSGMLFGLLLAVAPFHIYYSQEARPFALWGLLMGMAFLFQLKFCGRGGIANLVGYTVSAVLACYTFTYALFIVGFSILFSVVYRPGLSKQRLFQVALANGIVLLLFLPWLLRIMTSLSTGVGLQGIHRGPVHQAAAYSFLSLGFGTSFGPSVESLRLLGSGVFQVDPTGTALLVLGCLLLAVLLCCGLASLWRTNRNACYFSAIGLLVFWGSPAVLNILNPDVPYNPRYAFAALVPLMVAIVGAWPAGAAKGGWRLILAGLFLVGIAVSLCNHFFNANYARDDLRAAARFLREVQPQPARLLLCAGYLSDVFAYYYGASAPVEPVTLTGNISEEEALKKVEESLGGAQQFALIYSRPDHGDPRRILPRALEARHRLVEKRHWTGVDVFLFERNPLVVGP